MFSADRHSLHGQPSLERLEPSSHGSVIPSVQRWGSDYEYPSLQLQCWYSFLSVESSSTASLTSSVVRIQTDSTVAQCVSDLH